MDIHERLAQAAKMAKEQEKLLHRREAACQILSKKKEHLQELKKQLVLEGKDVKRLEGLSLQSFWHSLKGTKEMAKHKEQEEYLAAKMKFDAASAYLLTLEADIKRIDNELDARKDSQAQYQQAVKDKEKYLLHSGGPEAQGLFKLAEELGCRQAECKELVEAIDTGEKAIKALAEVEKSLSSAQSWGVVDILGGGLITTSIKHSHIGNARRKIDHAQRILQDFQTELADVHKTNESIEIKGLATMADFLLDGLLFDWIVQSQINTAQKNTRQLMQKIEGTIQDLQKLQLENQEKVEKLNEERRYLVENAPI